MSYDWPIVGGSSRYDYVIVGAGSAGATLAARLSEDPAVSVLLLEAGPDFRSVDTPAAFRSREIDITVEHNPDFFWPRVTARRSPVQEPYYYPRGRGLGGCSTVNSLCAIRGVPADYDHWVELGARGWGFADVLPAFVKLEDDLDHGTAEYHGRGGPVPVSRTPRPEWGAVDDAFCEAVVDAGLGWADDHNAPGATGVSPFALNVRDGRRVSTNDGYLEPARGRSNLTIRGGSQVDQLLFDAAGRRVVGVRLVDGERCLAHEGGEVIVSCGAVHSPAVLMRSGIGPAGDLRHLGIAPRVDLPVGVGVQDHAELMIDLPTAPGIARSTGNVTNCVLRYTSGLAGAGENDMMVLPNNGVAVEPCVVMIQQQRIFSRGRLTLCSADPTVEPLVEHGMLTDERDAVRMRDALERVRQLLNHRAFAKVLSGPAAVPDASDMDRVVADTAHACSTCRMGSPDDATTVVDPDCRVLGVDGVRVIDASVMPEITRANLHLTVVMIAEHMVARLRG